MKTTKLPFLAMALAVACAMPATVWAEDRITAIQDLVYDQPAHIRGLIEQRLDDDEFLLRDESGVIEVYTTRSWTDYEIGDTVTVSGRLDDDEPVREFYASSVTLYDGTVVELGSD